MNFKQKYIKGDSFIFSPNGKISRINYLIYAIIFEILYRFFIFVCYGEVVSPVLSIIGFLIIPLFVILKMFNYKKRANSFLDNNRLAYIYSIFYLIIGGLFQYYLYLLKLLNKKSLYEFLQDPALQEFANVNIPDFVGSNSGNIIFYIISVIGLVMFFVLLLTPEKNNNKISQCVSKVEENGMVAQEIVNENNCDKNCKNKNLFIILTLIVYLSLVNISYSEIQWRAYYWMKYIMNEEQVNYVNNIIKSDYEQKLAEYKATKKSREDILHSFDIDSNTYCRCEVLDVLVEPEKPLYYKYSKKDILSNDNVLRQKDFEKFGCTCDKFSLLSNKCGDLKFENKNRIYFDFYPYSLLILALLLLLPISFYMSKILVYLLNFIENSIKKLKINCFVFEFPKLNKKNGLTQKLKELNDLKEQGFITEEDYVSKKSKLLDEF